MTWAERALQIWPILLCAAYNRKTLTYGQVGDLIGMGPNTISQPLTIIARYCDRTNLPPLAALVVQHDTGEPGPGHPPINDFKKATEEVFDYKWFARPPIQTSDLE